MGADAANPWTWLLGLPFPAQEESLLEVGLRVCAEAENCSHKDVPGLNFDNQNDLQIEKRGPPMLSPSVILEVKEILQD